MTTTPDPLAGVSPQLRPAYQEKLDKGQIGQDEHGIWRWYWSAPDGTRVLTSGVIVPPGGGKLARYKRVTSFNKVISDTAALEAWKMRQLVTALAKNPDLIAAAKVADDDKKINAIVELAWQRSGADTASTLGSMIHAATHALLKGQKIPDLGEFQADVDSYLKAIEPFVIVDAERFGVSDQYRICGSWDRTLAIKRSGRPAFRGDVKTGKVNPSYLDEIAQQLASYTVMTPYDQATGQREQSIDLDMSRALVIHVPIGQGRTDLFWVPLEKAMRTLLPLSQRIFEARNGQTKGYAFDLRQEISAPAVDEADPIEVAIAGVQGTPEQAKEQLLGIWGEHKDLWTLKAAHYKALGDQRLADLARDVIVRAGLAAVA